MIFERFKKNTLSNLLIAILIFLGVLFCAQDVQAVVGNDSTTPAADESSTPAASAETTNTPPTSEDGSLEQRGIECGIVNGNILDCIPVTIYYLFYTPASWFLYLGAYLFDNILYLSISKDFVSMDFVDTLWTLVRDIANMAFIFILLYTGIMTMFGQIDWRSAVIKVVIIALLVNFSLFFSKVIIDFGNVLAVGIYSSMGSDSLTAGGHREITGHLVDAFEPQSFTSTAQKLGVMDGIVAFLIAGVVNIFVGWSFLVVGFMFLGRILAFWILMILSPIAFVSFAFPKGEQFTKWFHMLLNQSLVAPIFLFFLYIIMRVIEVNPFARINTTDATVGGFLMSKLFIPALFAGALVYAIKMAVDYTKKMSGEFGAMGSKIGGVATGLALGGVAMAGRGALGNVANRLFEGGRFQQMAGSNNAAARFVGRQMTFATDSLRNATFDARNTRAGASIGAGEGGGNEGYVEARDRRIAATKAKAEKLQLTEAQQAKIKENYQVTELEAEAARLDAQARRANAEVQGLKNVVEAAQDTATGQALVAAEEALKQEEEKLKTAQAEFKAAQEALNAANVNLGLANASGDPARIAQAQANVASAQTSVNDSSTKFSNQQTTVNARKGSRDAAKTAHDATPEAVAAAAAKNQIKNTEAAIRSIQQRAGRAKATAQAATRAAEEEIAQLNTVARGHYAEATTRGAFGTTLVFPSQEETDSAMEEIRGNDGDISYTERIIYTNITS